MVGPEPRNVEDTIEGRCGNVQAACSGAHVAAVVCASPNAWRCGLTPVLAVEFGKVLPLGNKGVNGNAACYAAAGYVAPYGVPVKRASRRGGSLVSNLRTNSTVPT